MGNKNKSSSILSLYKTLFYYQKNNIHLIILLLTGIVFGVAYECVVPIVFKWLFNDVLYSKDIDSLILAVTILFSTYVFLIISNLAQTYSTAKISSKAIAHMRFKMYEKILSVGLEGKDKDFESHLLQCFSHDITLIENVSVYVMWACLYYLILGIIGTFLLIYFNWIMALMVAGVIPFTLLLPRYFSQKTSGYLSSKKQLETSLLTDVGEAISMQGKRDQTR